MSPQIAINHITRPVRWWTSITTLTSLAAIWAVNRSVSSRSHRQIVRRIRHSSIQREVGASISSTDSSSITWEQEPCLVPLICSTCMNLHLISGQARQLVRSYSLRPTFLPKTIFRKERNDLRVRQQQALISESKETAISCKVVSQCYAIKVETILDGIISQPTSSQAKKWWISAVTAQGSKLNRAVERLRTIRWEAVSAPSTNIKAVSRMERCRPMSDPICKLHKVDRPIMLGANSSLSSPLSSIS